MLCKLCKNTLLIEGRKYVYKLLSSDLEYIGKKANYHLFKNSINQVYAFTSQQVIDLIKERK